MPATKRTHAQDLGPEKAKPKKRIVTEARREQNRTAQRAWSMLNYDCGHWLKLTFDTQDRGRGRLNMLHLEKGQHLAYLGAYQRL